MKGRRIFLYVQHLLGIGHLKRAATISNALAAAGFEVTLASGGFAPSDLKLDGVRLVQLPPASAADASFKVIVDAQGRQIDDAWKSRRREILLDAWCSVDPHALIVELFPFGRRQMRFELVPLLDAASSAAHRAPIVTSVRDVLGGGQKNPARQDEMLELFERYFSHLLVHGDPSLIPFDRTFRHAGRIQRKLHYTGYVVDASDLKLHCATRNGSDENAEVVVSAGGGAVGMRLLETAIRARPLSSLSRRTWRVLGGVNAAPADLEHLAALGDEHGEGRVQVERVRPDFAQMLADCALSVSQGGYNTLMEILQARARSVVVPFAGGAETEQGLRARRLADRGLIEMLEEDALTPSALAAAVDRAAGRMPAAGDAIDLGGAKRTAALLGEWTTGLEW